MDPHELGFEPTLDVLQDALVAPMTELTRTGDGRAAIYDGGVYAADGAVCAAARHRSGVGNRNEPAPVAPRAASRRAGTHLFAGQLRAHFGHFLLEGLGRLWGVDEIGDPAAPLLYLPFVGPRLARGGGAEAFSVPAHATAMLRLLGIPNPLVVVDAPVRVERLVVPGQLVGDGLGASVGGHPRFRAFMGRLKAAVAPHPDGRDVYVSRAGLPADHGGILLEAAIEDNFARQGYAIVRPETLALDAQIALYRGARRLVFAEGSALHLYALVAEASQQVAIVYRRPSRHRKMEDQVAIFAGRRPVALEHVRGHVTWVGGAGNRKIARQNAYSVLDLAGLGAALAAAGFLDAAAWRVPSADAERAAVAAQIRAMGALRPKATFGYVEA